MVRETLWRVFMKSSKGKELIRPDENWIISEHKALQKKDKSKRYWVNVFNRKLRRFFSKKIKGEYL